MALIRFVISLFLLLVSIIPGAAQTSLRNEDFTDKVRKMYEALNNGIMEANNLYEESGKTKQNKVLIDNQKSAIIRSLKYTDEHGLSFADYLGGKWEIPPKELSSGDKEY